MTGAGPGWSDEALAVFADAIELEIAGLATSISTLPPSPTCNEVAGFAQNLTSKWLPVDTVTTMPRGGAIERTKVSA